MNWADKCNSSNISLFLKKEEEGNTSLLEYHARQVVSTGSLKVLMAYLVEVTGTLPSLSPLQIH